MAEAPGAWRKVTTAYGQIEAHLIAGHLEQSVEVRLEPDRSSFGDYLYGGSNPHAAVDIYVREEDLASARGMLEEIESRAAEKIVRAAGGASSDEDGPDDTDGWARSVEGNGLGPGDTDDFAADRPLAAPRGTGVFVLAVVVLIVVLLAGLLLADFIPIDL